MNVATAELVGTGQDHVRKGVAGQDFPNKADAFVSKAQKRRLVDDVVIEEETASTPSMSLPLMGAEDADEGGDTIAESSGYVGKACPVPVMEEDDWSGDGHSNSNHFPWPFPKEEEEKKEEKKEACSPMGKMCQGQEYYVVADAYALTGRAICKGNCHFPWSFFNGISHEISTYAAYGPPPRVRRSAAAESEATEPDASESGGGVGSGGVGSESTESEATDPTLAYGGHGERPPPPPPMSPDQCALASIHSQDELWRIKYELDTYFSSVKGPRNSYTNVWLGVTKDPMHVFRDNMGQGSRANWFNLDQTPADVCSADDWLDYGGYEYPTGPMEDYSPEAPGYLALHAHTGDGRKLQPGKPNWKFIDLPNRGYEYNEFNAEYAVYKCCKEVNTYSACQAKNHHY